MTAAASASTMMSVAAVDGSAGIAGTAHTLTAATNPMATNTSAKTIPSGSTRRDTRRWMARMMRAATPSADAASTRLARRYSPSAGGIMTAHASCHP